MQTWVAGWRWNAGWQARWGNGVPGVPDTGRAGCRQVWKEARDFETLTLRFAETVRLGFSLLGFASGMGLALRQPEGNMHVARATTDDEIFSTFPRMKYQYTPYVA